jgi:hypothetical protein
MTRFDPFSMLFPGDGFPAQQGIGDGEVLADVSTGTTFE